MGISVKTTVDVYEVNGEEVRDLSAPKLEVMSHWNRSSMVVLQFPDGRRITVVGRELEAAISNATRHML